MQKQERTGTKNEVEELKHLLEQKKHELEIEAALERVRAVAMGMNEPGDMIDVCRIISKQLQILKVENIRNVQTAIINDEKGTYLNYEFFTQYNTNSILEIESKLHPKVLEFVNSIKKSKDAFFSTEFKGKDLEDWIEYRRKTNQNSDPILEKAKSVHYYFYSIGPGALGLSTYVPLISEQLDVFRRFHNVFMLAYKRFMDIKKAEEQAREAQIEAALERVRTASMSMHSSSELREVVQVLYTQLQGLNLSFDVCDIQLRLDDSKDLDFWTGTGDEIYKELIHWPYINIPIFELVYKAWGSGKTIVQSYGPYETQRFLQGIIKTGVVPESRQKFLAKINEMQYIGSYQHHAGVDMIRYNNDSFTQTDKDIVSRFAKAFEQSYVRFLDLQKAEEQVREAQIEAALERVRATSLAMRKTSDISRVVEVYFKQLRQLNIDFIQAWINVFHLDKGYFDIWFSPLDGVHQNVTHFQMPSALFEETTIKSWRKGEPFSTLSFKSESEVDAFLKVCDEVTDSNYFSLAQQYYRFDRLELLDANYKYGAVSRTTREAPTEQHKKIFQRFAKVFEQTYTRFLDLQKAEAQARESKIEAALERVRSRSMAMYKSEELGEVIEVVFKQMMGLDLQVDHVGFILDYQEREDMHIWFASKQVKPSEITIPYFDSPHWNSFRKAKSTGEKFFTNLLDFKTKNKFYKELFKHIPPLQGAAKKNIFERPGLVISTALLEKVGLYFENYTQVPFTDDENDLLIRFANVFEQAYIRFLDLKKAEAQAREAKIEAALERVRAQAMAMHQTGELKQVVDVVFQQLKILEISLDACYIDIFEEDSWDFNLWVGTGTNTYPEQVQLPFISHPFFNRSKKARKEQETFYTISLDRKQKDRFVEHLGANYKVKKKRVQVMLEAEGVKMSTAMTSHAALSVYSYQGKVLTAQENEIIKRIAAVFEQAYTRFLDLKNAEAQVREAEIEAALERVRAASMAMHASEELQEVIRVLYDQIKSLAIPIDSAQLGFPRPKDKDLYLRIASEDQVYLDKIRLPYTKHPVFDGFWDNYNQQKVSFSDSFTKKEKDAFFKHCFANSDLGAISDQRKKVVLDAPGMERSNAIMNQVSLSIINYQSIPYSEEDNALVLRFGEVFYQSYIRFLDLQKAEAQAREAQIETALERVRAVSMAMHHSNHLVEAVRRIKKEISDLGIFVDYTQIFTDYTKDPADGLNTWVAVDGMDYLQKVHIPFIDHPVTMSSYKGMAKGLDYVQKFSKSEKNSYFKEIFKYSDLRNLPKERKDSILNYPGWVRANVPLKNSMLQLARYNPDEFSEDEVNIFKRFGKVFEQAYTRFLDLQKAEKQAREAEIEAALERVRASSMAMHNSKEVGEVVKVLYEEFAKLELVDDHTDIEICIIDEDSGEGKIWQTEESLTGQDTNLVLPFTKIKELKKELLRWRKTEPQNRSNLLFIQEYSKESLRDFLDVLRQMPEWKTVVNSFKKNKVEKWVTYNSYFQFGMLTYQNIEIKSTEIENVLPRFTKVFEQTYTRFLDLQKAEAQAREAQIEAALERVRARSMAMHKSDELQEVINRLFEEIESLGVDVGSSYIVTEVDEDITEGVHIWVQNNVNLYAEKVHLAYLDHPLFHKFYTAWKEKVPFYTETFNKREKNRLFNHLFKKSPQLSSIPEERKKHVLDGSGFTRSVLILNNAAFVIQKYDEIPYKAEDLNIQKRFGNVFEQTYTRFLDLKKAEAQAREAQIEAALERVRSKAMSMQHSEDLSKSVATTLDELEKLELKIQRCGVGIFTENKTAQLWTTTHIEEEKKAMVLGELPLFSHPMMKGSYKAWQKKQGYTYVLEGDDLRAYYTMLRKEGFKLPADNFKKAVAVDRQYYDYFSFPAGGLYVFSLTPLSDNEGKIVQRFADVFHLAFTRYLDLQNAEARAVEAIKQASLDRVRAEIASMRTAQDLQRITPLIWSELTTLDVPFIRCGVFIMDNGHAVIKSYLSTPDGKSLGVYDLPYEATEIAKKLVQRWNKKKAYTEHWDKQQFLRFMETMAKRGLIQNRRTYQGDSKPPESLDLHFVPFKQGMLYVGNSEPLNDQEVRLVKSLAEAFSIAYARYEDFIQLEHAKNQIENALGELKSTQTQLIHSEKMASLGELTAGIAHEIQNPLNFVNNFSEVSTDLIEELLEEIQEGNLEEVKELTADIMQNLEKINHHGKRASSIVKGMLEHSRSANQQKEPTDINLLADEYLRLAYHGFRAKDKSFSANYKLDLDESLPKISVISQDIGRVLLNLINNAFYAVSLKAKNGLAEYKPEVMVRTKRRDNIIEIRIKDNGSGVPSSIVDKIFQPFFTTKPTGQGTGLGLSLSYDIITKGHNGNLEVDTNEGIGTMFIIQLPVK